MRTLQTKNIAPIEKSQILETGNRLWMDGKVFGGGTHSFVHIHLEVNIDNSRRPTFKYQKRQYFGDISYFFLHDYDGCVEILALVTVHSTEKVDSQWPCIPRTHASKKQIINVREIQGFAGRAIADKGHEYIYWSQLTTSEPDPPMDHKLQYIFK